MLGGGPGDVGGPSSASAITQALHWLSPPHGTILHVRSVETQGSADDHARAVAVGRPSRPPRAADRGGAAFETAGGALYDPATDTIYDAPAEPASAPDGAQPDAVKRHATREQVAPGSGKPGDPAMPAGDPVVDKVRILLQEGRMVVKGREIHDGIDTWAISLKADVGRPVWTLWVSAADGKPVELRDPGRDASEQPQVIRWPAYEVLPGSDSDRLLTLTGAHPTARVVHDPAQAAAAQRRLEPPKP